MWMVTNVVAEKKEMLTAEEWSVDQQMLAKLKEQYKRERHRDTKSGTAGSSHISDRKSFCLLLAIILLSWITVYSVRTSCICMLMQCSMLEANVGKAAQFRIPTPVRPFYQVWMLFQMSNYIHKELVCKISSELY